MSLERREAEREMTQVLLASLHESTGIEWSIKVEVSIGRPTMFSAEPAVSRMSELSFALQTFVLYHAANGSRRLTRSDAAFAAIIAWCQFCQFGGRDV